MHLKSNIPYPLSHTPIERDRTTKVDSNVNVSLCIYPTQKTEQQNEKSEKKWHLTGDHHITVQIIFW